MNKRDLISVSVILLIIIFLTSANLVSALVKRRDSHRKQNIRSLSVELEKYHKDFGFFPRSTTDGKIIACKPEEDDVEVTRDEFGEAIFGPCDWGWDGLLDLSDPNYPPYMEKLPVDPHHEKGARYFYISNGNRYQIYASLEGEYEAEFDPKIKNRNLSCGTRICNFGLSYGQTPLDKSIEEYENELRETLENEKNQN